MKLANKVVPTEDAEKELEQRVSQSIPLGRFSEGR
jgi:hypothetical protein